MTVAAPTSQTVIGGLPIVALNPPPEGQAGSSISYTVPPGTTSGSFSYQLSAQAGLPMSQVMTICVDNTANPQSLTIIHGAFNEVLTIAPNSMVIAPTFSTKAPYTISFSLAVANVNAITFSVIYLNYPRPSGSFASAAASTVPSTQITKRLSSGLQTITPAQVGLDWFEFGTPNNAAFIYELTLTIGSANATAAGSVIVEIQCVMNGVEGNGEVVFTMHGVAVATAAGQTCPLNLSKIWSYNSVPITFIGNFSCSVVLMFNATTANVLCEVATIGA